MKKILCIVQLPPPVHGESIMNESLINSKLLKDHYEILVLPLRFARNTNDLATFSILKLFKMFIYSYKLVKIIINKKPDIAYFTLTPTGCSFYRDLLYTFILKLLKVPIIYHLHGKGIKYKAKSNKLNYLLYKWAFKNVKVICLSEKLKNDINDIYKNKIFIVPNGIKQSDQLFMNSKRKKQCPTILYLSNYKIEKGLLLLIDALKIIKRKNIYFNARLVGSPSDVSVAFLNEYITERNLENYISIIGPKYDEEKIKEFQNADMFIFPTYYKNETFGLVNLEAMQSGLPIISTFEGAIPEIIDDGVTGFLVPQKDVNKLAEKIEILINDPILRCNMGKAGRKKFLENYTIEKFEQNMKNVFDQVLNQ